MFPRYTAVHLFSHRTKNLFFFLLHDSCYSLVSLVLQTFSASWQGLWQGFIREFLSFTKLFAGCSSPSSPMLPLLPHQELVAWTSHQTGFVRQCHWVCRQFQALMIHNQEMLSLVANCCQTSVPCVKRFGCPLVTFPFKGVARKLQPHFLGPFVVSGIIISVAVRLDLSPYISNM